MHQGQNSLGLAPPPLALIKLNTNAIAPNTIKKRHHHVYNKTIISNITDNFLYNSDHINMLILYNK